MHNLDLQFYAGVLCLGDEERDSGAHSEHIADHAGFCLLNVQNDTANTMDRELLEEALGFRSICLFSNISDEDLKRAWDDSNLEYFL